MDIKKQISLGRKPESRFYPINSHCSPMDVFQGLNEQDIWKLIKNKNPKQSSNFCKTDRAAFNQIQEHIHITVLQGDKGGSLVVMNTTDYISEATHQLSNSDVYTKLIENPTKKFELELANLVKF